MSVQVSLSVSGRVAITATRSSGRGDVAEIDGKVLILEVCLGERRLADDVAELGRGMGEQAVAIGEQEVEFAEAADVQRQLMQGIE